MGLRALCALTALSLVVSASPTFALPAGRAWAPAQLLTHPEFATVPFPVLDVNPNGKLVLMHHARGGTSPPKDMIAYEWADTAWRQTWRLDYGAVALQGRWASAERVVLLWSGADQDVNSHLLFVSDVVAGGIERTDTVAVLSRKAIFEAALAISSSRRWVVVNDFPLRIFHSDVPGEWIERTLLADAASRSVAVESLDDTTALVVWSATGSGVEWGTLRGAEWQQGPEPIGRFTGGVATRPRPSGGIWLANGKLDFIEVQTFLNDAWTDRDTIPCSGCEQFGQIYAGSPVMSRDGREYPAIIWYSQSTVDGSEPGWVMIPDENGFTVGENAIPPPAFPSSIARDENGDVWVAWWHYFAPTYWMHTYTVATTSTPTLTESSGSLTLHWSLSEPAPGTWWAVMRSVDGGPHERIARLEAGVGLAMQYVDTAPPNGELRYRIRRECVDERYQWLSEEVVWDGATGTKLTLLSAEATPERVALLWQGTGAGGLEATVERRSESTDWEAIGVALPESTDRLRHDDSTVAPGTRYGYRLAYTENGEARHTATSWVDVPERHALALEGFQPNPARAWAVVAFTLPSVGRGTLEVLDVSGRRVFSRKLDDLGAGRHTLSVDAARDLAPGVYIIRLAYEGRRITSRGVIVQ